MTGMPELIALLHSFVGLAAVLVGWNGYLHVEATLDGPVSAESRCWWLRNSSDPFPMFIGSSSPVTFTGSIVASSSSHIVSLMLRQNYLNLGALPRSRADHWFVIDPALWLYRRHAVALPWAAPVASIGAATCRGRLDAELLLRLAAAASGFLLENDLLIITGALVGSSGAYLSSVMCKAMNRSFVSVIAGGFGIEAGPADDKDYGEHREITAEGVAELLGTADSVIITPATAWPWPRPSTASPS
ncbi:NAD(P)(+) transhydrogenase (Re/Si-specific) subunit beta [Streptomyces sp. F001]|uniref:NAD(P)(+) transhydrogenase (Re/Si-specific) subunit beta n=1 Tax=Streptomyces sp. F001 TaxID=1510026 RepID=UPI001F0EF35D|nr:NAD(P)(+) transhydrogenase (Re/Si-specific) subunit beta [Streptomyces sp. F001]